MADNNARRRLYNLLLDFYKGKLSEDFFDDVVYRKFYRKIYFETFRHLGFIQKTINNYLKNETGINAYASLVLAVSQILYIDDVPDYAAVNESVNIVHHKQKGFVNAVLRNIIREKEQIINSYDIKDDFPEWFLKRWKKRFTSKDEYKDFLLSLNSSPDFFALNFENMEFYDYDKLSDKDKKQYYSMDKASSLIPLLAGKNYYKNILDACAAPGGKTLVLSKSFKESKIIAVEKNGIRIQTLIDNVKKYFANNVVVQKANFLTYDLSMKFDLILLDAPCTALGTIRKHPEVRWFKSPKDIVKMSEYQFKFLEKASELLNETGKIIYSVCSLEPEEGKDNINRFLKINKNFKMLKVNAPEEFIFDGYFYSLPHKTNTDGFFATVIQKQY
jgi:16S rRNA (cytosine967-C5)-methyltransferase